jgi:hypothetical protein
MTIPRPAAQDPPATAGSTAEAQEPPVTYNQAEAFYPAGSRGAAERFSELSQRDLSARAGAILRVRGEFDPENNLGHRELAAGSR